MDWDNPAAHHPEWPAETRYLPQRALGATGATSRLIWTNTVAFQKLQRFAHGDIELDDYLDYRARRSAAPSRARALPLCQRRGDFRFPARPLPHRGEARR